MVTDITAVWLLKGTSAAWIHGIQTTVKPLCMKINLHRHVPCRSVKLKAAVFVQVNEWINMLQNMRNKRTETRNNKKQCLAAFSRYGMLTRLVDLLVLCPVFLSATQYTKIKLESRKKTRIFNLKRIRITPQSLLQVLHIALTAVDTVHIGRSTK